MKKLPAFLIVLFISGFGFAQESPKTQKRERMWIYDVNITKDETGKIIKVEKTVFGKGTPGAASQVRYFETKGRTDASGNIIQSTRERIGENNVDPAIIKQYGTDSNNPGPQEK